MLEKHSKIINLKSLFYIQNVVFYWLRGFVLKVLCSVSDGGAARSSGGLATLLIPLLGCGLVVVMSTD